RQHLTHGFDFESCYLYTQMLRDCIEGKNDSWAVRWYASAFLLGKLTLYPASALVQNIGADGSGTHMGTTKFFENAEWGRAVRVENIPVEESQAAREAFSEYFTRLRPSIAARVLRRLKRLVSEC